MYVYVPGSTAKQEAVFCLGSNTTAFIAVCISLTAFAYVPSHAVAQSFSSSVSVDPLGLAFGMFNVTYERGISTRNSFTVFASHWTTADNKDWTAYGVSASYRSYVTLNNGTEILEGLSLGPYVSIGFWSWDGAAFLNYGKARTVVIGVEGAYKWVFGGFVFEPIFRLDILLYKGAGISDRGYGLGANLGYAW